MYKFKYETFTERAQIFNDNKDKFFIEEQNLFEGNYLIFSDDEPIKELNGVTEIENKISILEAENETLKQELSITQDAVNELIFNSLNM